MQKTKTRAQPCLSNPVSPLQKALPPSMPREMRLSEFFSFYLESARHRLKSIYYRERCLERLKRFFGDRPVAALGKADLMVYIDHERQKGKMPSSVAVDLLHLSGVYAHMNKCYGWDLRNPVSGLPLAAAEKRVRYIEKEEAARLLECARQTRNGALADFIELALNTGCRKNELLQLRFQNIDRKRNILTIDARTTKTGKARHIPVNRNARKVFERREHYQQEHCPGSPWVFCKKSGERYRTINWVFNKAVRQADIENFHIHDLRHTFASWLVSAGVELTKIRDLLGHSSVIMTERYAHLAPDRLHDAVNVLDGFVV